MQRVLVDTGPLVSILSAADEHHEKSVEALRNLHRPLFSCWPLITEAAWLLRTHELLRSIQSGFLELLPINGLEAKSIADVLTRYESARPQLLVPRAGRN
jgi:uncharacterized protein